MTTGNDGRYDRRRLAISRDRTGTWGNLNRNRLRAVREFARGRVVDIGCASDAYTSDLRSRGHRTVSVDLLPLDERPPHFVQASASQLPFPDGSFDSALLFEVLEHVPDPERALHEIGRVAGRLIMSVPDCTANEALAITGLAPYHYTDPTHVNFFDDAGLREVLGASGWRPLQVRHVNPVSPGALSLHGWGLPTPVLRRVAPVLKRLPRPRPITMSIVAIADRR